MSKAVTVMATPYLSSIVPQHDNSSAQFHNTPQPWVTPQTYYSEPSARAKISTPTAPTVTVGKFECRISLILSLYIYLYI